MLAQEVIRHKRDGKKLTDEEIEFFIRGVADWSVSECQIAAFAMAVCLKGLDCDETVALTKAMASSGQTMSWADLNGPVIDKHSTGGVGDKVSAILAPVLAACGAYVPMISGRGLGHTGGTVDKFDSISGYSVLPDTETFHRVVKEVGCAVIGATSDLAPADKRIYAVRDATDTIESPSLITASVLSKKLAGGANALVVDLKCGNGAFMSNIDDARTLAGLTVTVAQKAGLPARALITDMNQVLGRTVGNALEIAEAVEFLKGSYREPRLLAVSTALCSEALLLTGLAADRDAARTKIQGVLDSGKAAEIFARMVAAMGGPADFIDNPQKHLPQAAFVRPVLAEKSGYIRTVDTRQIGNAFVVLGGGRSPVAQKPDFAVGFADFASVGSYVEKGAPLAVIHAQNEETFAQAEKMVHNYVEICEGKSEPYPTVYETITV